jgi:S-ribosylhomocysteine lyase LuxS involved in autoinducer biosynthesis
MRRLMKKRVIVEGAAVEEYRMTIRKKKPNQKMQSWIDARKRYKLSHLQVQMARELGMNPKKCGMEDNHDLERCKMPLRNYIAHL